jgi:hypothetical protein
MRKRREEVKKEVEEERTVQGLLRWIEKDLGEGWYRESPFELEGNLEDGMVELPTGDWGCLVDRAKKLKNDKRKKGEEGSKEVKEVKTAKGRKVLWRIDDEDTLEWEFVEDGEEEVYDSCTEDGWHVL